jgi:hypothetical protein
MLIKLIALEENDDSLLTMSMEALFSSSLDDLKECLREFKQKRPRDYFSVCALMFRSAPHNYEQLKSSPKDEICPSSLIERPADSKAWFFSFNETEQRKKMGFIEMIFQFRHLYGWFIQNRQKNLKDQTPPLLSASNFYKALASVDDGVREVRVGADFVAYMGKRGVKLSDITCFNWVAIKNKIWTPDRMKPGEFKKPNTSQEWRDFIADTNRTASRLLMAHGYKPTRTPRKGDVAIFLSNLAPLKPVHYGVVTNDPEGVENVRVQSKLGTLGVYDAPLWILPSFYGKYVLFYTKPK